MLEFLSGISMNTLIAAQTVLTAIGGGLLFCQLSKDLEGCSEHRHYTVVENLIRYGIPILIIAVTTIVAHYLNVPATF